MPLLRTVPGGPLVCAESGREPRDDENAADEWRALDVDEDLPVFCPECAEREFGACKPRWFRQTTRKS